MQSLEMLTDDILENDPDESATMPGMRGYMMAALARSHKGSFGSFAQTTFDYLKDARLSGYTPEVIARELLERGVMSYVPDMLMQIIEPDTYKSLPMREQTKAIQALNLTPYETERTTSVVAAARKQAEQVVKEAVQSGKDITYVLQSIASGEAASKQGESLCLATAIHQVCPYIHRRQCVGCQYEISTKSTFYLLISEFKRLRKLHEGAKLPAEKEKYRVIISDVILPKLNEMLMCIQKDYGEKVFEEYETLLQEEIK